MSGFDHPRIQLRDIEQAVQQCLKGVESALQVRQRLLTSWAVNVALEHAGKQDEGLKGLAQVMTGRRQELGFRQVGALRLLQGAAQRLLRRLPLGDVAGDLSEADQSAGLVPDRINDDAGPEPAAILAHPPAFGFERPVVLRRTQRLHRYARGAIRVGVEAGEMLADDFSGGITLQPLRTRIPVRDVPGRIEHEDGVVDDALDQQAKALLTLPQGLLGSLAISDVAGDLCEADQVAGVVPDGVDDDARPEATAVLAHPPAFGFEHSLGQGDGEGLLGRSGLLILWAVEAGEVLADDLASRIALEALRARVPTAHNPLRIKHEDGVIADAINEQLEASFTGHRVHARPARQHIHHCTLQDPPTDGAVLRPRRCSQYSSDMVVSVPAFDWPAP